MIDDVRGVVDGLAQRPVSVLRRARQQVHAQDARPQVAFRGVGDPVVEHLRSQLVAPLLDRQRPEVGVGAAGGILQSVLEGEAKALLHQRPSCLLAGLDLRPRQHVEPFASISGLPSSPASFSAFSAKGIAPRNRSPMRTTRPRQPGHRQLGAG